MLDQCDDLPELIKLSFARLCEAEGNSGKLRGTQGKLKETVQTKPRGGGGGKAMMRLRAEETQTKTNGQMAA